MPKPPKYSAVDMLDAAAALVAADGPTALTVSSIAKRLRAPSGSIYHRFRSRDVLVASLWLRCVDRFQEGYLAALENQDPHEGARAAAAHVLHWSRGNPTDARILLLYRSQDLLGDEWPTELREQNRLRRDQADQAINHIAERLGARTSTERRRVIFALVDIPYRAVRSALARGDIPAIELDLIVDDAVAAVLAGIQPKEKQ